MTDETVSRVEPDGGPLASAVGDLTGRVIAERYRVDALLGEGGMGAVYRATELGVTARTVAIKVILAARQHQASAAARFEREARAAAKLSHPHTLRVFEYGQTPDGLLYLVTEYLSGRSLGEELEASGALPMARAVELVTQAARGLSEAHAHGMVHRDLKPDNLFLVEASGVGDFVKVIDFGLALLPSEAPITQTGAAIGTPAYMAPEQVHGREATPATDVYALGVILFELLTGRRPFDGASAFDLMTAQIMEPPPPLAAPGREFPEALVGLVAWCLDKEPRSRPADAGALLERLEGVRPASTHDQGPTRRPVPPTELGPNAIPMVSTPGGDVHALAPGRSARVRWGVGAALVVGGIAAALWWPPGPAASESQAPEGAVNAATPQRVAGTAQSEPGTAELANAPAPTVLPAPLARPMHRAADIAEARPPRDIAVATQVRVTTVPPGARVRVGKAMVGRSPLDIWVPLGAERSVVVSYPKYAPRRTRLQAMPGVDTLHLVLRRSTAKAGAPSLKASDFDAPGDEDMLKKLGK